jgi:predicted glycogen debranching enzyme
VAWGELSSRYDALLAANLCPDHPDDRWVMLTRCRIWLVYQGYSQQLGRDCLQQFHTDAAGRGCWRFLVPCGQGQHVAVTITVSLATAGNQIALRIQRKASEAKPENLPDQEAVQIILRPDIENRSFHATTKAFTGPETEFPAAVTPLADGFLFRPQSTRVLKMNSSPGEYVPEAEWHYMVHRSSEAERGQDPDSDLFSPGYFRVFLEGDKSALITAVNAAGEGELSRMQTPAETESENDIPEGKPLQTLTRAMDAYVVNRGRLKSVIAGYPWFLDWGRDALIFTRGLIAAGRLETARAVLKQFGQFESGGTLPNMIAGDRAANRDTSDAPLWFFTACNDLLTADRQDAFLEERCGDRTLRDILKSIGRAIIGGAPNGVCMDPESALIFSPGHFTWMDTNHPAGTPREGYPVEIQALWIAALDLMARIDGDSPEHDWTALKSIAREALIRSFWIEEEGYFSDCLHTDGYAPASQAMPDDALRPNQLLTITLDAIDSPHLARQILAACEELLVPGAIRSLADRAVKYPLPIYHHGDLLNNPGQPYYGIYSGDEDTRRKPAYHNGTAWTWPFPSYCEAWSQVYGTPGKRTALAWLTGSIRLLDRGCVGQIPEILDGNIPHRQRGCDAQAWGVSEWVRVWKKLVEPVSPVRPQAC